MLHWVVKKLRFYLYESLRNTWIMEIRLCSKDKKLEEMQGNLCGLK